MIVCSDLPLLSGKAGSRLICPKVGSCPSKPPKQEPLDGIYLNDSLAYASKNDSSLVAIIPPRCMDVASLL